MSALIRLWPLIARLLPVAIAYAIPACIVLFGAWGIVDAVIKQRDFKRKENHE